MERKKLTRANLRGNWCTLLLPVDAEDRIGWDVLAAEINYLTACSPDGIYSNGTAGEFHNQTEAEFDVIQEMLSEQCHATGIPFQIGAGHPAPIISLERIRRTVSLRPDAYQVILPDWVAPNPIEQRNFLADCASAAQGIPLVLYNPPHARQRLSPEQLQALSEDQPALIGVKVGGGDPDWYQAMQWSAGRFSVFVPGHHLASGFATGVADGAYSNVACLSPRGAADWWALMQSDTEAALDIERRIHAFFEAAVIPYQQQGYSNPALDKLLAAVGGWCPIGTRLRRPYMGIEADQVPRLRALAAVHLPAWFD